MTGKSIIGYHPDGRIVTYSSIREAERLTGCFRSQIQRAIKRPVCKTKGIKWTTQDGATPTEKLPRAVDEELKELGVSPESVSTVWAKQMKNGTYRYSIKFSDKDEGIDTENLLNSFRECIEDIEPVEIPFIKGNNKALLIYTADKHVGAMVNKNSMYDNHYDGEEFKRRMTHLLSKITYLANDLGSFNDIFIIDLGDPLDGFNKQTTRGSFGLPQNMSNEEAFDTFIKVHTMFFDELVKLKVASRIHFKAVTNDNHSGSFGYTAQRALQIYLNVKYPDIETQISDKFMSHFHIGEHTFIITHGKDREDRIKSLPLNLNDQTKNFITDYIDYHKLSKPAGFIHVIKGDMHQAASQLTGRFRYRNVLSLFGASSWIQNNFGSQTIAGVAIDVIDKDRNISMEYNLILN